MSGAGWRAMGLALLVGLVPLEAEAEGRAQAPSQGPGVGDRAPGFALAGSDGRRHGLRTAGPEEEGPGRGVVLAFFPKAFTPG